MYAEAARCHVGRQHLRIVEAYAWHRLLTVRQDTKLKAIEAEILSGAKPHEVFLRRDFLQNFNLPMGPKLTKKKITIIIVSSL